jgi:hypothetical protein
MCKQIFNSSRVDSNDLIQLVYSFEPGVDKYDALRDVHSQRKLIYYTFCFPLSRNKTHFYLGLDLNILLFEVDRYEEYHIATLTGNLHELIIFCETYTNHPEYRDIISYIYQQLCLDGYKLIFKSTIQSLTHQELSDEPTTDI